MFAIVGAKIYTITKGIINNGVVLVKNGLIEAVGTSSLKVPAGYKIINAKSKCLTPGLIDAHTHLGTFGEINVPATADGNEMTNPVSPFVRGIDSFNPQDPAIKLSLQGGVTTAYTGPGSGNIIGGTGFVIKTHGNTVYDMVVQGKEAMKFALGENPKGVYKEQKKIPSTRMGNAAVMRQALMKAEDYVIKQKQAQKEGKHFNRDLGLEQLAKVLNREYKARIHAHRADDIITAIRIAEEFNLDYSIEHCTQGYHVADILADKGCFCVIGPLIIGPYKHELWDVRMSTPAVLNKAGAKVIITMDAVTPASHTKYLAMNAGLAIRYGLDEEAAFKAITINAAELIAMSDKIGSIEVGKEADLVIFDGHPLSNFTNVEQVFIAGERVV
ncbi:amidohydrolase [Clostridium sp. 'deep sea']|uniref:amidohydrolase n=1 Tax=Clostridium sp. 'deep sea' TaxID=2779445 RepID=UPI0018966840|nr:amidohydrolase [Clostridium sp. 'deep sea']QOR36811.1 amidohydrolase [Clostridium sp. 'deep sea']